MNNLILVGFSCSGKSTLGRVLARRLRLRFVDTDRRIEQTTGRSVPTIFAEDGEAAFREIERQVVAEVCRERFQVVSTGGGAFVDPTSRVALCTDNLVVHLRVKPHTVLHRLRNSRGGRPRPLLAAPDPLQRITELMEARRDAYALANVVVDVDNRSIYDLAGEVVSRWFAWRRAMRQARGQVRPAVQPPIATDQRG